MKKENILEYIKTFPDIIKLAQNNLEDVLKNIDNIGGVTAIIVKLFGKQYIDSYFEKLSKDNLEDFGFKIYLKASINQGKKSLETITLNSHNIQDIKNRLNPLFINIEKNFNESEIEKLKEFYEPTYYKSHPCIVFIRDTFEKILSEFTSNEDSINSFLKDFNTNIKTSLIKEFGDDYEKYKDEIELKFIREKESIFLESMMKIGKVGFTKSEDFKYEETLAFLESIENFKNISNEEYEREKLFNIEELINEYFKGENHLKKILFVISDFGKGKSVFMRHFASKLAKKYLKKANGLFPIYFNLRDFESYNFNREFGILQDYLESDYQIDITEEYYSDKEFIFLVDSLDESGKLTNENIDRVIESIKSIHNIDKTKKIKNRIIITSRPFEGGLEKHLKLHEPLKDDKKIPQFISIYGFTKKSFNDWLNSTLKSSREKLESINTDGFISEIKEAILNNREINIYKKLIKNSILSKGELKRPIFAYMIYQLILNNTNFLQMGKIGVYLSFLNILTKDAKHIEDSNYRVNLNEELRFRNILHSTSALWLKERQKGKQGTLKRADICRAIHYQNINDDDKEALTHCKDLDSFEFLSHSYFGDRGKSIYFNHQSFAEILLAEYYLKLFIKYALDTQKNLEELRLKLLLGEPTEQTIIFLRELLNLLKECAIDSDSEETVKKRRLLAPLIASMTIQKDNNLFSEKLFIKWLNEEAFSEYDESISEELLKNWQIKTKEIEKIIEIAQEIIESKENYLPIKAEQKVSLFEVDIIKTNEKKLPPDMDRWLALLVGNELYNDEKEEKFFNSRVYNFENIFELIRNWNYYSGDSAPNWGRELFKGIDCSKKEEDINLSNLDCSRLNFSYSKLYNISFEYSNLYGCNFSNVFFNNFNARFSNIKKSIFNNIKIEQPFKIEFATIELGLFIPYIIYQKINNTYDGLANNGINVLLLSCRFDKPETYDFFDSFTGLLIFIIRYRNTSVKEIKTWFIFDSDKHRDFFYEQLDELKKYERES